MAIFNSYVKLPEGMESLILQAKNAKDVHLWNRPFINQTIVWANSCGPRERTSQQKWCSQTGCFNPQPLPSTRNGFKTNSRSKMIQIPTIDIQYIGYPETSTHYPPCGAVQPCHRGRSFSKGINGGNDHWALGMGQNCGIDSHGWLENVGIIEGQTGHVTHDTATERLL